MKKKSDVLDLVMMGPSEEEPAEEGGEMEDNDPDDSVIAEARSLARELLGLLSK